MDRQGDEGGFTLLELVIALLVLSVAVGGLIGVLDTAFKSTAVDAHRADAVALANRALGRLRTGGPATTGSQVLDGQSFSVSSTRSHAASSGGVANAYQGIVAAVTWTDAAGAHRVEEDSATPGPSPSTATTVAGCPAPVVASAPAVSSPPSGDPAVDVAWTEPGAATSVVPIVSWAVETSPDGTTWTVGAEEPVAPEGTSHVVEIGGLSPGDAYAARLLAFGACGSPGMSPSAVAPTPTPPAGGGSCTVGSVTVDAPVAPRASDAAVPGALAHDLTVVASTVDGCPDGLWAGVITSGSATSVASLTSNGSGWFSGVLTATTGAWDLGPHLVEVFRGVPVAGPLPSSPLASVEVCVTASGGWTC